MSISQGRRGPARQAARSLSPASAAATTPVTPPPAQSVRARRCRPCRARARRWRGRLQGGARVASGGGSPFGRVKRRAREPAELVFSQLLAAAAAAFLADDHGIELTCVVNVLHLAREADGDGEGEASMTSRAGVRAAAPARGPRRDRRCPARATARSMFRPTAHGHAPPSARGRDRGTRRRRR